MQGIALGLGMTQLVGIKSAAHVAYDPASVKHFANAYDGFWKVLGGVEMAGHFEGTGGCDASRTEPSQKPPRAKSRYSQITREMALSMAGKRPKSR